MQFKREKAIPNASIQNLQTLKFLSVLEAAALSWVCPSSCSMSCVLRVKQSKLWTLALQQLLCHGPGSGRHVLPTSFGELIGLQAKHL